MERKEFLDDLGQPAAVPHPTSAERVMPEMCNIGCGGCSGGFVNSNGIGNNSSNQVEMISKDGRRRIEYNDNGHSFEPPQQQQSISAAATTTRNLPNSPVGIQSQQRCWDVVDTTAEKAPSSSSARNSAAATTYIDQEEDLLLGKRNEWSSMMQQIVESGESKLMRHRRRVAEIQQQEHRKALDLDGRKPEGEEEPGSSLEPCQLVVAEDGKRGDGQDVNRRGLLVASNSKAFRAMLLKSPAFATNTLDDAELDKLATTGSLPSDQDALDGSNEMNRNSAALISGASGTSIETTSHSMGDALGQPMPTNYSKHNHRLPIQLPNHEDEQIVTDCDQNSSANMINRRHDSIGGGCDKQDCSAAGSSSRVSVGRTAHNGQIETDMDMAAQVGACRPQAGAGQSNLDNFRVVTLAKQVASNAPASSANQKASDNDERPPLAEGRRDPPSSVPAANCLAAAAVGGPTLRAASGDLGSLDELDRGGPTPTNDLIRTLIHRDRLALGAATTAAPLGPSNRPVVKMGSTSTSPQSSSSSSACHGVDKADCGVSGSGAASKSALAGCAAHRVVSEVGRASGLTREAQTATTTMMIRAEMAPEPNLTSSAAHNNDTCPMHCCFHYPTSSKQEEVYQSGLRCSLSLLAAGLDPCCAQCGNNNSSSSRKSELLGPKSDKCIESVVAQRQTSQQQQPTTTPTTICDGLPTLIGKCRGLQLSPEGCQQPEPISGRSTQPYQVTSHGDACGESGAVSSLQMVTAEAASLSGSLRQPTCAYKFPLLLKGQPGSDEDDEDDADEDESNDPDTGDDNSTYEDVQSIGSDIWGPTDGKHSDKLALLNSSRLRTSASSPSALSTPTNDERGGCGEACCRRQHPASRLGGAGGLATNESRQSKILDKSLDPSGHLIEQLKIYKSSSSIQQHRKISLSSVGVQGQAGRAHKRLGSNPLDRLRLVGGLGHRQWDSANQSSRSHSIQQASSTSGCGGSKRHSIISALTGGTNQVGGQLVNRLSHPRSFFSSASQHHNTKRHMMSSTDCQPDSMAAHYEPLIPETGFKIVVMGTSGSGKTSIIQRFMYDSFSWRHNPTVEDTYFIEFPYMKNMINISISDTSGTYQFPAMRRLAISSGDAFILVYSVDDPKSFHDLEQLRQTILDEREQAYSEASFNSMVSNSGEGGGSSSGLASVGSQGSVQSQCAGSNGLDCPQNNPPQDNRNLASQARHWSLASIFQHNLGPNHHGQPHGSLHSSVGSFSSTNSCSNSNSADHSRRSSISAAEAALKTRRTRHPPMVIVANKHDLGPEKHLVNSDEIEALVEIDWNNGFVRASAATNLNIDHIFQQVLRQARQPPALTAAIVSKRRKSLPPKLPQSMAAAPNMP